MVIYRLATRQGGIQDWCPARAAFCDAARSNCRPPQSLGQFGERLVEELDAPGHVLEQVLEVAVLVLDREVALVALALELLQACLGVVLAGPPSDVVAVAELIE